jgi:alginate O-acetyltransferase complex protein AlgI
VLFDEFRFLFFFALCFLVHWSLRGHRARKLWLLGASYLFYAAWDWRFLGLIWLSTGIDYGVGLALSRPGLSRGARRAWLALSLTGNLGILGVFKYLDFFVDSAATLLAWLGLPMSPSSLQIVLPVGISFYTFQTLSYTFDVYRGQMRATRDLADLALFVGFFPQLVAGPIVRARDFLPQLEATPIFLIGFFKKAVLADNLAPLVQAYFAEPATFGWQAAWVAAPYYAVQLYCDFSGYSDMAIATAGLLGYRLCQNFRHPFLAADLADFWRRWHISLSTWLRDYLYIPLGGSRGGLVRTCFNLFLVLLLAGLWHGASATCLVSGALFGAGLVAHRLWTAWPSRPRIPGAPGRIASTAFNAWWFCLCALWFPAPDLRRGLEAARAFALLDSPGSEAFDGHPLLFLAIAFALHVAGARLPLLEWSRRPPLWAWAGASGAAFALMLAFSPGSTEPFLYFQF